MPTPITVYETDDDGYSTPTDTATPTSTAFNWVKASIQRAFAPSARTVFLQAELHKERLKNQRLAVHTHELQSRVGVLQAQLEEERGSTKRKLDQLEDQLIDSVRRTVRDEINDSIVSISTAVSPSSTASPISRNGAAETAAQYYFRTCGGTPAARTPLAPITTRPISRAHSTSSTSSATASSRSSSPHPGATVALPPAFESVVRSQRRTHRGPISAARKTAPPIRSFRRPTPPPIPDRRNRPTARELFGSDSSDDDEEEEGTTYGPVYYL